MSEWLLLQYGAVIYVIIFMMLMGGAIGLPIPEDIPLVLGGILSHRGNARIEFVLLTCYLGSVIGDVVIFMAGRKLGAGLFEKPWFRAKMNPIKVTQVRLSLERRTFLMIFIARHLFYLRTVTFLTCGAVKMTLKRFLLADALAALVSVPLMVGIGFACSEHYEVLMAALKKVKLLVLFGLIAAGCVMFLVHNRRKMAEESESDLPSHT